MRIILSILISLISFTGFSQVFQTNNSPFKFRGLIGDSMVVIPSGSDTGFLANPKWGASMNGALFFKYSDSTIWAKYGQRWLKVGSGGGGMIYPNAGIAVSTGSAWGTSITPSAVTKLDDTNVTIDFSGNNTIAVLEPIQLRMGWVGTLADSRITSAATWNAKADSGSAILNTTTQEQKRFNVRAGRLDSLLAASSAGINVYSNNGTLVATLGAGGGANATFQDGTTINGQATLNSSVFMDKNDLPITSANSWILTVDTPTNRIQRRLINTFGIRNVGAIGSTPNANGAIISNDTLYLQPASATFGGVLTSGTQDIAGNKRFTTGIRVNSISGANAGNNGPLTFSGLATGGGASVIFSLDNTGGNSGRDAIQVSPTIINSIASNTTWRVFNITPSINHTSINTSDFIGLDYNPTITALNGSHYAALFRSGSVGIGTATPAASSLLDISSTTQGALLPRLNTTQQNAIASPATGLLIWNTDSINLCHYTGSAWRIVGGSGGGVGITSLNSLTGATQTFTTGTTGTDFGISSSGTTHTFNLPTASSVNRGALSTADWSTFNGKANVPDTATAVLYSDVQLLAATTWYTGLSITLGAGTWIVSANAHFTNTAALSQVTIRLTDGTNTYGSAGGIQGNVSPRQFSVTLAPMIVVLSGSTTLNLQGINDRATNTYFAANTGYQTSGRATYITAYKIR